MNTSLHGKRTTKGFTIIEFLVASVLAIIVIIAAGNTYFMTRKLGDSAQKRLAIQQNLRTAGTLLMRDARMAGSFGCYNSSSSIEGRFVPQFNNPTGSLKGRLPDVMVLGNDDNSESNDPNDNRLGISKENITINSTTFQDALIFVYGLNDTSVRDVAGLSTNASNNITGITLADNRYADTDAVRQALADQGPVVLSSCRAAYGLILPQKLSGNTISGFNLPAYLRTVDAGEISLSRLYTVVYGVSNGTLMRVDTNPRGEWNSPQILAYGINNMEVGFGYTDNCDLTKLSSDPSTVPETFTFTNHIAHSADKKQLPSVVQLRLNYNTSIDPNNPTYSDYVINATVRGGNTCGTRVPLK